MHIGIVGAGFTGSMLAVQLLRQAGEGLTISLIESGASIGRGVAYGTDNPDHFLNVRVANMSAFADDPSHFLRWLWMQDGEEYATIPPSGHAFVSRRTYGDYIAATFQDAVETHTGSSTLSVVAQAATQLHPGLHPVVSLADGRRMHFDRVALCVGNFPAAPPPGLTPEARESGNYLNDPWQGRLLRAIQPQDDVLILGSGLTMADAIQSLIKKDHTGAITVVSRHGLAPLRHEQTRSYHLTPPSGSLRDIVRSVRREVTEAGLNNYDWRDVIDALRPSVSLLWQALPEGERRRFLRHLRPFWDIHRHRLPPSVADGLEDLRRSGQLRIIAGRLGAMSLRGGRFQAEVTPRGHTARTILKPMWIINCTGPQCDYGDIRDPLIRRALESGVIRPDPLQLGIDVTADNAVIDADGHASGNVVAVGPPTKGAFWEVTAVPDIRVECARVAKALLDSLRTEHAHLSRSV